MISVQNYTKYSNKLEKSFPHSIFSNFYVDRQSSDSTQLFQLIDRNRAYLKQTLAWLDRATQETDSKRFIEQANNNFIK
ncbi:hypothetical protein BIY23_04325 [Wolbachia pipientis]|uniref:Uncharacterized protein n=1 Tax=Wolbachia pipientis TaxID=955 RepID=A0A1E7QIX0_WOLPI|nr:hypothetical protein [Wolbachia pipientis]OEY86422.1 hypothetical protein BIY23_04325 [Wolbachia pipientis]